MKCPRCDRLVIHDRTEWWCIVHGSFGHTIEARDIKYEPATGGSAPGRQWRRLTDDEIAAIQSRYQAGEPSSTIARLLGVGHTTVWRYVQHLEPQRRTA